MKKEPTFKWQHKRERDRRICDRIKAVLLYEKGGSLKEMAEALLLMKESIRLHIDGYTTSKKLKPEGGGTVEKLSTKQSRQLEEHFQKYTYLFIRPLYQGYYGLCAIDVGSRLHSAWPKSWLHRHGFSYKKPAVVPSKANEEQQKEWIAEYEKLKQNLPGDETICFIDGVHSSYNIQPAYG